MESFLKERESVTGEGVRFIVGDPLVPAPGSPGGVSSQRRETAVVAGAAPRGLLAEGSHAATCEPSVKPLVKDGRVTSILVRCSCGKETEIGLDY